MDKGEIWVTQPNLDKYRELAHHEHKKRGGKRPLHEFMAMQPARTKEDLDYNRIAKMYKDIVVDGRAEEYN